MLNQSISARQAIATKYLGPTNHRGSRIVATCEAGRLVVPLDYALNTVQNHAAAAIALARKLGWLDGPYAGTPVIGGVGYGYVVVFMDADSIIAVKS